LDALRAHENPFRCVRDCGNRADRGAYAILSFETREKAAPKAAGPNQQKGSHLRDPGSAEEKLGEGLKIEGRLRLRVPSAPAPSGGLPVCTGPDFPISTKSFSNFLLSILLIASVKLEDNLNT